MSHQISINENVLDLSGSEPRLLGSRCRGCGNHTFPIQSGCVKCSGSDMETVKLGTRGELWAWTVQGFPPKSPPYLGEIDPQKFIPYGVGYVSLPEVKVEARLTESQPSRLVSGMTMVLTLVPLAKDEAGNEIMTFAFAPVGEKE
jgi:uncharacterized OB-fold protein